MRALNPRRPQLTSTFGVSPRFFLCFLLVLFAVHDGRARSVSGEKKGLAQSEDNLSGVENQRGVQLTSSKTEDSVSEEVQGKLLASNDGIDENIKPEEPGNIQGRVSQAEVKDQLKEAAGNNIKYSSVLLEGLNNEKDETKVVDASKAQIAESVKAGSSAESVEALNRKDDDTIVVKKRRRNDVSDISKSQVHDIKEVPVEHAEEAKNEGIRRFDLQVDTEDAAPSQENGGNLEIDNPESIIPLIGDRGSMKEEPKTAVNEQDEPVRTVEESDIQYVEESKEEIPNYFRKSVAIDEGDQNKDEEFDSYDDSSTKEGVSSKNRQYRYVLDPKNKSRRHISTVYLNAEEKKISDGEQQSIVEGQIKKLISIRDDALDAQKTDKLDETKLLGSKVEDRLDEVAFMQKNTQKERNNKVKDTQFFSSRQLIKNNNILGKWRAQAIGLQEQIRNRTFLTRFKEQATEILPEIPKFTENQLLATLEQILLSKKGELNDSYTSNVKNLGLTDNQLRIIKCAEQLVAVRERQSFASNLVDCIRGLNAFNCIKIFVWPVLVDNLPTSFTQNLEELPIEINVFDLFQGNKQKTGRAQNFQHVTLIPPEAAVNNILQDVLKSYPKDETLVSYIDPNDGTLKKILTTNQVSTLQMGEKLLPQALRLEYSDKMFSCVRQLEYVNCVKYIAWPMIKQYFPTLPAFPDYPNWYPVINPSYPIASFPSVSGNVDKLPEVVDAALRTSKPKPEATIIQVLQDTLKAQSQISTSPSYLIRSTNVYDALLPLDQLLSINMAEQLIPVSLREEFVQKTVKCMKEYNYLTCIKYSTWPTVRQFVPTLPDISNLPDFQVPELSDIVDYIPSLPSLGDLSDYWPIGGLPSIAGEGANILPTYILLKSRPEILHTVNELEEQIMDILLKVRESHQVPQEISPFIITGNSITFPMFTKRQLDILRFAECLIPPVARPSLITEVLVYLQRSDNFIDCAKYIIWPTVKQYIPDFPKFPELIDKKGLTDLYVPIESKQSRNGAEGNVQQIHPTDTRFGLMSTENPEMKILTILRSAQSQLISLNRTKTVPEAKSQEFLTFLTETQMNIAKLVDSLLPQNVRNNYINKMLDCLRVNDFLNCTRNVTWPTLTNFVPWLNTFDSIFQPIVTNTTSSPPQQNATEVTPGDTSRPSPDQSTMASTSGDAFRLPPNQSTTPSTSVDTTRPPPDQSTIPSISADTSLPPQPQNKTLSNVVVDSRHLSETDVKTGQHGDATVTITDTRFVPIFTEHPETLIFNILRSIQVRSYNVNKVNTMPSTKNQELINFLNGQQVAIVNLVDSLLPENIRTEYINKMIECLRINNFLICTRNVTWPTLSQYFPWLPDFPNFGPIFNPSNSSLSPSPSNENMTQPSSKSKSRPLSETDVKTGQHGDATVTITDTRFFPIFNDLPETVVLNILKAMQLSIPNFSDSPAPTRPQELLSYLTEQQLHIVNIAESLLPTSDRLEFITRLIPCSRENPFIQCTKDIIWPTVAQFNPWLPNFPNFGSVQTMPRFQVLAEKSPVPNLEEQISQDNLSQRSDQVLLEELEQITEKFPIFSGLGQLLQYPPFEGILPQKSDQLSQRNTIPQLPTIPQFIGYSDLKFSNPQPLPQSENQETSSITPSVDNDGAVPSYAGQPPGLLIDVSNERVQLPDNVQVKTDSANSTVSSESNSRKRRSIDLLNTYYETEDGFNSSTSPFDTFPNITESEFLQLLIKIKQNARITSEISSEKQYYVDTLNSTTRNSLTADQYEILKVIEDLDQGLSSKGLAQQVIQCIQSLSFIRCLGIFIWPMIINTLPSLIGLPSLPSLPSFPSIPGLGLFGRSLEMENKVQEYFGMSAADFENELLTRKNSIEHSFLEWYKKLVEDEFQTDLGFLKIKGYGNGELGISLSGVREGRGAKLKDNKNLPSILTIISDIMEEVLDQRPEGEKSKKEKDKKERSIDISRESDIQFLKDSEEYVDIKRSMDDDEIITMFLDKIKSNDSQADDEKGKDFGLEDAYNAFGDLFGTRLHGRQAHKSQDIDHQYRSLEETPQGEKEVDIVPLASRENSDDLKVLPLKTEVTYDLEKESSTEQEEKQRKKRAKHLYKALLEKHQEKYLKDFSTKEFEDINDNKITNEHKEKIKKTGLIIKLPRLDDKATLKKMTGTMLHIGKSMKTKMTQMMPGIGLVVSFLIQMALAHARAAASMAGMLSNMAIGSAIIGMIRDTFFGSNKHPQIKHVYDNNKIGPGISWPTYGSSPHYRRRQ